MGVRRVGRGFIQKVHSYPISFLSWSITAHLVLNLYLVDSESRERTLLPSYHPLRDEEIKIEDEEITADLEVAKRDQAKLKKYVRVDSPRPHS